MHDQRLLVCLSLGLFLASSTAAAPQAVPDTLPAEQDEIINEEVLRQMVRDMNIFQKNLKDLLSRPLLKPVQGEPITSEEIRNLITDMREVKLRVQNLELSIVALTNDLGKAVGLKKGFIGKIETSEAGHAQLMAGSEVISARLAIELERLQQEINALKLQTSTSHYLMK